jgi:hypothetical protein
MEKIPRWITPTWLMTGQCLITAIHQQFYWIGVKNMTNKPIEQARNPLLRLALPALERAALQARKIAAQTGTALIIMREGQLQRIQPDAVKETPASYQTEHKK